MPFCYDPAFYDPGFYDTCPSFTDTKTEFIGGQGLYEVLISGIRKPFEALHIEQNTVMPDSYNVRVVQTGVEAFRTSVLILRRGTPYFSGIIESRTPRLGERFTNEYGERDLSYKLMVRRLAKTTFSLRSVSGIARTLASGTGVVYNLSTTYTAFPGIAANKIWDTSTDFTPWTLTQTFISGTSSGAQIAITGTKGSGRSSSPRFSGAALWRSLQAVKTVQSGAKMIFAIFSGSAQKTRTVLTNYTGDNTDDVLRPSSAPGGAVPGWQQVTISGTGLFLYEVVAKVRFASTSPTATIYCDIWENSGSCPVPSGVANGYLSHTEITPNPPIGTTGVHFILTAGPIALRPNRKYWVEIFENSLDNWAYWRRNSTSTFTGTARYGGCAFGRGCCSTIASGSYMFKLVTDTITGMNHSQLPATISNILESGIRVRVHMWSGAGGRPSLDSSTLNYGADTINFTVDNEYAFDAIKRLGTIVQGESWVSSGNNFYFVTQRGTDRRSGVIFRNNENCQIIEEPANIFKLANRIYVIGAGSGSNRILQVASDTTSINTYGLRDGIYVNKEIDTSGTADVAKRNLLTKYKNPIRSFRILNIQSRKDVMPGDQIRIVNTITSTNTGVRIKRKIVDYDGVSERVDLECGDRLIDFPDDFVAFNDFYRWFKLVS